MPRMRRIFGLVVVAVLLVGCAPDRRAPTAARRDPTPSVAPATSRRPAAAPTTTTRPPARPSPERRMRLVKAIRGDISPKSVVASGDGHFIAQNMMYRHSITVYDRVLPAGQDHLRPGRPGGARRAGGGRAGPRRTGGGGVLPRRPLRLRLQLLDVRARVRPRGQRQLLARFGDRPQLRLPAEHAPARRRPRRPVGRSPSTSPSPPTGAWSWSPTGAPMTCRSSPPGRSRSCSASASAPTRAGSPSTPLPHRLRRGHGLDPTSPRSTWRTSRFAGSGGSAAAPATSSSTRPGAGCTRP